MNDWKEGFNAGLSHGVCAVKDLSKKVVSIQAVQALLKETYEEMKDCKIAAHLPHDTDKAGAVASKFHEIMLNKLAQVNDESPSTIKVIRESANKQFPMRIRCQRVKDEYGFAYGKDIDFCGHELEIEAHDVKAHEWSKYPNLSGLDYGVICPVCKQFVVIDRDKLPKYVKDAAEKIQLK